MLSPQFHANRRAILQEKLPEPILLMGNGIQSRNLPMNHLPFRQDSSFLYFTGAAFPNAALLIMDGEETLFLESPREGDELWHGPTPSPQEITNSLGISNVLPYDQLLSYSHQIGRQLHCLAVSDPQKNQLIEELCGYSVSFGMNNGSDALIDAIISMRRSLLEEELEEMRQTALVTCEAHLAAMRATKVGGHERDIAVTFNSTIARAGLPTAYESIVTVDGHILHNFYHINPLEDGQLLLLDGGAESLAGYATDVTRTWPVSGQFSGRQEAAYSAVLEAQKQSIDKVRSGIRYREVHNVASKVIADFLKEEGLLNISAMEAVETGAHALFFPHGIGHLIGLDVHDMENFGDRATYPPSRKRSPQFGTSYLRLDLDLQPNMVVTIEPGFYIVPAILNDPTLREKFQAAINWDRLKDWDNFGGIRIEDNIRCTTAVPEVLTSMIPKEIPALEALVGVSELS